MKKLVAAIFIFILMIPQVPGVMAKGFDTGKYSAIECLAVKKQENAKDLPRLNEIFAKKDRYAFSDEVTSDEIALTRACRVRPPVFQAYAEKGSFASLIDYSDYFYYYELNQLNVSERGAVYLFASFGPQLTYNSYEDIPDEATVIEIIDRDIGRVNDILLFHMEMDSTYYHALLFFVTTDQNRYLIPFNVDTHFCHLQNGKVYTEARAMEIMGTFLEDTDFSKYQGQAFYPGPSDMTKKNPTDAQIAALGLTDTELYRSSSWPAAVSSQSAVSSTPSVVSSTSSEQQPSSSEKQGEGDQSDNMLWLALTGVAAAGFAVAVLLRVRRRKRDK